MEEYQAVAKYTTMAAVLTFLAEELGQGLGLIWSGVHVALKLNRQLIDVLINVATKLVKLLLLLTQKVSIFYL